uniref:hypothetical protein n=1 Tax=Ensifer adhaerens TaxID=106592 RepID=UPI003F49896B
MFTRRTVLIGATTLLAGSAKTSLTFAQQGPFGHPLFDEMKKTAFTARNEFTGRLIGTDRPPSIWPTSYNAIDQAALNRIFFDNGDSKLASAYLAYAETYLKSQSFRTPGEARVFFHERSGYYNDLASAQGLDQSLQGMFKSGFGLGTGILGTLGSGGAAAGFGLGVAGIDAYGSYSQLDRTLKSMFDLPDARDKLRALFGEVRVSTALNPEGSRPLLKMALLGNGNASDEEFNAAVMNLPPTKQDVIDAAEAQGGIVTKQYAGLTSRLDKLQASLLERNQDIDTIERQVGEISEHLVDLSERTANVERSVATIEQDLKAMQEEQQKQARIARLQSDIANFNTTVTNIGTLLNWNPEDVNKATGVLEGVGMMAVGYLSSNPMAFISGASTVAATLFGKKESKPSSTEVILQAIQALAKRMDQRFDRIEQMLGGLDDRLIAMRDESRQQFRRLHLRIDDLLSEERVTRAIVVQGFSDLKSLLNAQVLRDVKVAWEGLVQAASYYEDSFYIFAQTSERDRIANQVRLNEADRVLREKATAYFAHLSLDELGLGNAAYVGLPSDHTTWLADLSPQAASSEDAEAMAHRIFVGLRTGRYRSNGRSIGHSVHRILSVIQKSIPAIEFAPEHAHWFEQGPGTTDAGVFKPFQTVPLFDPSDVLEIYKSSHVLLAAIPNIDLRRWLAEELNRRLTPAAKMVSLWSSISGTAQLTAAYPDLVGRLYRSIAAVFGTPYARVSWDICELLQDIATYAPTFDTFEYTFWDPYTQTAEYGGWGLRSSRSDLEAFEAETSIAEFEELFILPHLKAVADFKRRAAAGIGGSPSEIRSSYQSVLSAFVESLNAAPKFLDSRLDAVLRTGKVDGGTASLRDRLTEIVDLYLAVRTVEHLLGERVDLANAVIASKADNLNAETPKVAGAEDAFNNVKQLRLYIDAIVHSLAGRDLETSVPLMRIAFPTLGLDFGEGTEKVYVGFEASGEIVDREKLPAPLPGDSIEGNRYRYFLPNVSNNWSHYSQFREPDQKPTVFDYLPGVTVEGRVHGVEVEIDQMSIVKTTEKVWFGQLKDVRVSSATGAGIGTAPNDLTPSALAKAEEFITNLSSDVANDRLHSRRREGGFEPNRESEFASHRPFSIYANDRLDNFLEFKLRFELEQYDWNDVRTPVEDVASKFAAHVALCTQPTLLHPTISDACFELLKTAEDMSTDVRLMSLKNDALEGLHLPSGESAVVNFVEAQINAWYAQDTNRN